MAPDLSSARKNLKRHGITWEEKCWLLVTHQGGRCALCLSSLSVEDAVVDHFHGCVQSGTHKYSAGCRNCIRGALCSVCNSPVLLYLERFSHLQNDFVRDYLAHRPFIFGNPEKKT